MLKTLKDEARNFPIVENLVKKKHIQAYHRDCGLWIQNTAIKRITNFFVAISECIQKLHLVYSVVY